MIDINGIPDEKPRRGPARMGKSEKDADARRRYKIRQRIPRLGMFYLRVREPWEPCGLPEPIEPMAPTTHTGENND